MAVKNLGAKRAVFRLEFLRFYSTDKAASLPVTNFTQALKTALSTININNSNIFSTAQSIIHNTAMCVIMLIII